MAALEKGAKNKEKAQPRVDRERAKLAQIEKERNEIEENTTPSEREAAEARVAERNEELGRLQTQVEERERAMPLRERVGEIFKKYGLTVTAIFLAAGVTIGAVMGTVTNALKKLGKNLADGLKTIGAKDASAGASALAGLIRSIVGCIFKAAGSAIGFLAEQVKIPGS